MHVEAFTGETQTVAHHYALRWKHRTFHALVEDAVYGFIKVVKKDYINHVQNRKGAALRALLDRFRAQGEPLEGRRGSPKTG